MRVPIPCFCVGHSMGGGVAALFAMLLKHDSRLSAEVSADADLCFGPLVPFQNSETALTAPAVTPQYVIHCFLRARLFFCSC